MIKLIHKLLLINHLWFLRRLTGFPPNAHHLFPASRETDSQKLAPYASGNHSCDSWDDLRVFSHLARNVSRNFIARKIISCVWESVLPLADAREPFTRNIPLHCLCWCFFRTNREKWFVILTFMENATLF